ncbi:MAG: EamA family transporter [Anaerolineaceae bacterium]|nr:EamA family transporter [Anaerolineaceae bacterium]
MTRNMDTNTYLAFAGAVLIGGANFVAVSFSNRELPPLFGAALRFALAAIIFFLIMRVSGVSLARGRAAAGAAVYGLLGFGGAYAFIYYALVGLAAGTVAVIMAAVPLFTLMMAVLLGQEWFTVRGIVGGSLAIAGIAVLSLGTLGGDLNPVYLIAAVLGAVAASASTVAAKSLPNVHPLNMNAIGMTSGAFLLTIGSLLLGERWALPNETNTWLALSWLVVLGSVGLFQLFLYVVRRWTASATVYALTGMPVVAVALGAVMLGQPVTPAVLVGGAMVIAAVYVGAARQDTADAKGRSTPGPARQREWSNEEGV